MVRFANHGERRTTGLSSGIPDSYRVFEDRKLIRLESRCQRQGGVSVLARLIFIVVDSIQKRDFSQTLDQAIALGVGGCGAAREDKHRSNLTSSGFSISSQRVTTELSPPNSGSP